MARTAIVTAALVLMVGCTPTAGDVVAPDLPLRADLVVVEPDPAAPGETLSLTFPQETLRGLLFALDQRVDGQWLRRWLLTSDANGGRPMAYAPGDEYAVEAIGIGGPGPDRVVVPDGATPGTYRVCTANAGQDVCAELTIRR